MHSTFINYVIEKQVSIVNLNEGRYRECNNNNNNTKELIREVIFHDDDIIVDGDFNSFVGIEI